MKRIFATLVATLLLPFAMTGNAALPTADSQGQPLPTLAPMLDRSVPAVVNIFTQTRVPVKQNPLLSDPFFRHFFDLPEQQPRERLAQSLGSGVIVDAQKGYILTNHHVIDRAVEIAVHLSDRRTLKAKLIGTDPETDVALLQVEADRLTALPMSDSDTLRVGDFVVAIGNPFGLGQTVTSGIVSALGRSGLGIEGYEDFIQTDASINPGNSGGALVNLRGELVGLNTAILSKSGGNVGIGFAIPINMVQKVMEHLIQHGQVLRGRLGAEAQDLTPELAAAFDISEHRGAVVTQVEPHSPADKAGLQSGDIITHINGKAVHDSADVHNAIGLLRIGEVVTLTVNRNGRSKTLRAEIKAAQGGAVDGQAFHSRLAGAKLGNIVEGMPIYGRIEGVVVLDVAPRSAASAAGFRKGDIIVQANRQPVTSIEALQQATAGSSTLLLNIRRGNSALFVFLR